MAVIFLPTFVVSSQNRLHLEAINRCHLCPFQYFASMMIPTCAMTWETHMTSLSSISIPTISSGTEDSPELNRSSPILPRSALYFVSQNMPTLCARHFIEGHQGSTSSLAITETSDIVATRRRYRRYQYSLRGGHSQRRLISRKSIPVVFTTNGSPHHLWQQ